MLDLLFDSVVDAPLPGSGGDRRSLRFRAGDCSVEVTARGVLSLEVDIDVEPAAGAVLEVRTRGRSGQPTAGLPCGHRAVLLSPGLTSFFIRWPADLRRPARTAWVPL